MKSMSEPPRAIEKAERKLCLIKVLTTQTLIGPTGIQIRKPTMMPVNRAKNIAIKIAFPSREFNNIEFYESANTDSL